MTFAKVIILFLFLGLASCATTQERLAKRVGCDSKKLVIHNELHVPAYDQYKFTCEDQNYVCKDAPFHRSCKKDDGKE